MKTLLQYYNTHRVHASLMAIHPLALPKKMLNAGLISMIFTGDLTAAVSICWPSLLD
jgi:hypothetical protein